MRVLVVNGPNLNLLGQRQPEVYGSQSLQHITQRLDALAGELDLTLEHFQSNSEGALIDCVQDHAQVDAMIVNPGGYTHTSVALRDALLAVAVPFVEVHLSQPAARGAMRHQSFFSDIALGTVSGLGGIGYELALRALARQLDASN